MSALRFALLLSLGCAAACTSHPPAPRTAVTAVADVAPAPGAETDVLQSLSVVERERLLAGASVEREQSLTLPTGRYVGGVAYQIVDAPAAEIYGLLRQVQALGAVLPRTERATLIDERPGQYRVELEQGSAWVAARYTVLLRPDPETLTVRFWMDPTAHHDISDVWGFFRVQSLASGSSLVTIGTLFDVGPGLIRALFEERIQRLVFTTPGRIRDYVAERRVPDRRQASLAGADSH